MYGQLFDQLSQHSRVRDLRPLKTLAWMVSALLYSREVNLAAWEPYVLSRATQALSTERRWQRFISNCRISVIAIYVPLVLAVLRGWQQQRLYLAPTILKLVLPPSRLSATTMTPLGFIEFVPLFVNLVLPSIRKDLSGSQGRHYVELEEQWLDQISFAQRFPLARHPHPLLSRALSRQPFDSLQSRRSFQSENPAPERSPICQLQLSVWYLYDQVFCCVEVDHLTDLFSFSHL